MSLSLFEFLHKVTREKFSLQSSIVVIFRGRDIIRVLDEKQEAGCHDCHAGDDASYAVVMMTVFFGSRQQLIE